MLKMNPAFRFIKTITNYSIILLFSAALTGCGDDNAQEFWSEGLQLMEEGNPNGAIVFFRNALDEDSNNVALRHDLIKAYIASGRRDQAQTELEKSLVQEPKNIEILLTAANFYTSPENAHKALEYVEKIESYQQPTAETRELAGINYRLLGQSDEAKNAYNEALALDSSRSVSKVNLAAILFAENSIDEGLALLDETISENPDYVSALQLRAVVFENLRNYEAAEKDYRKLTELQPNDPVRLYSLAKLFLTQAKIEEAEEVYTTMLAKFKSNSYETLLAGMIAFNKNDFENASILLQQSVNALPTFDGLFYLANSLRRINNSESALSQLRRILDVQPNNSAARMLSAQILQEQGRYQEAEYELNNLISYYPENAQAYSLLGIIQRALGKNDEALISLENALKYDSRSSQAVITRSQILFEQNKEEAAVAELEKGIENNSGNLAERSALFDYYMKKNDYEKAEEVLQEAFELSPDHPLLLAMKASLHTAKQENALAIETLQKAYAIDPNFMPVIQVLLNIYMLENNYEAALALCDDFLKNSPENTDFLVTSATLLDTLGRTDEATARLEKANTLNSERALISLVQRALSANDKVKAEKYLLDKLQAFPIPQVRFLLASYYVEQDELQKALDVYNLEEIKNSQEALTSKFKLYSAAGMHKEALAEAELFIQNYSQSPDGYVLKSFALEGANDFDAAFATMEEAYTKTREPKLLIQLANLCLRNANYDKALSYYRTYLLGDRNNREALSGQAYTFLQQKNYEDAIAGYEFILSLYPTDLGNKNNLAMALAEEGINTARAVELAMEVFVSAPENINIMDTYAYTLLENGQIDEAINILSNGLKANPNSAILNYRLGVAYIESNQTTKGIEFLETSVELGGFPEVEDAKKLILENK